MRKTSFFFLVFVVILALPNQIGAQTHDLFFERCQWKGAGGCVNEVTHVENEDGNLEWSHVWQCPDGSAGTSSGEGRLYTPCENSGRGDEDDDEEYV